MDTITRADCKTLHLDAEIALREVAGAHGLTVTVAPGSFDASNYRPRVTFSTPTAAADVWAVTARMNNLPPLGTIVTVRGTEYKLTGWNAKSARYPINVIRCGDGKAFRIPLRAVQLKTTTT